MADAITIKELQDASVDAGTLEEYSNVDKMVKARKGLEYPSAPMQARINTEKGLLPATAFGTKAKMIASALPNGSFAVVTQDSVDANNGNYQKASGSWVYLKWNPSAQAKEYTDEKAGNVLSDSKDYADTAKQEAVDEAATDATGKADDAKNSAISYTDLKTSALTYDDKPALFSLTDTNYNLVVSVGSDAGLSLVGIDGTVQENINNQKNSIGLLPNISELTHAFIDSNEEIMAGFDKDAGLRLVGTTVSIQEQMNLRPVKPPHKVFHERGLFAESCDKYFINMSVSGLQNAPVANGLLPQRYTVPDTIVDAFTLPNPVDYIPIDTPYGDNSWVVHPYIIEFNGGFRGYRYLLCINPYDHESHENPTIYGSHDLVNFELTTGHANPLEKPRPGRYFSDSGFCYDPQNGMLVCWWRDGPAGGGEGQYIKYRATRDGIQWTSTKVLISAAEGKQYTSPMILFNPVDGLWHLWANESVGITHSTATHLNNKWTEGASSRVDGFWHGEVKWVGDKYVMLVNKRHPASNLYFAISTDGDTWTGGEFLFKEQQDNLYKATYLHKFNEAGQLAFDVFYTTNHASTPGWKRRFFHLTTNFITI